MTNRIDTKNCFGILVDVQDFFLRHKSVTERKRIEKSARDLLTLLAYLRLPILITIENPVDKKGGIPRSLLKSGATSNVMQKDYFDLTKEAKISRYLTHLDRKQAIVAGCETDVCVMQSCFGLLENEFEVFLVEDLLFSSSQGTRSAIKRMQNAGATLISLKSLFHELLQAQEHSKYRHQLTQEFGKLPRSLAEY